MKVCILGNTGNNVFKAYSWFVKTTAEGFYLNNCEVVGIDYKTNSIENIEKKIFNYKPDILFTHLTFHKHKDKFQMMDLFSNLRRLLNITIIHTMQDARHEPRYSGDISDAFDLALVGQTENIEKFQNYWKVPVYYWPYSSLTYNKMADFKNDLAFDVPVFTGNPNTHSDRSDFIRRLQKELPIKIIKTGSKEDLRNRTAELSRSAKCILGLCTKHDDLDGYLEVRPWQYLGAGACMIMRKFKGIDNIIPNNLYYSFESYDDPKIVKELFEKVKKDNTWEIKKQAFNFIQKYHSSKIRMKQTLEIIKGKRDKLAIYLDEL